MSYPFLKGQLKSDKSLIYFDLNFPDDCLGMVSLNSINYINTDLLHYYFEKWISSKKMYQKFIIILLFLNGLMMPKLLKMKFNY